MTDEKQEQTQEQKNAFGVTSEEIKKSKDILPTFDIGKLPRGSKVYGIVLCDEPKPVEHEDKFSTLEPKAKIQTPTLKVLIDKVEKPNESEKGFLSLPFGEPFTLWLSSKSMALDFATIYEDCKENNKPFNGTEFKINIGTAVYKKFGENTVYNVSVINKNLKEE